MDKGSIIGGIAIVVGAGIYAIDSELFFLLLAALIYMGIYLLFGVGYFNNDTIKKQPKSLSASIFYLPAVSVALILAFFLWVTSEHIAFFPMLLALVAPPAGHWLALQYLKDSEKKKNRSKKPRPAPSMMNVCSLA